MNTNDTIIAPATAVGEGGIAVVRISGPRSLIALKSFFKSSSNTQSFKSHHLYHGILVDSAKEHIDEVMAVYMASPHTYTRDEVVEIHCHGSQQVVKSIIGLYLSFGLRLAEAGEFTYRAFINGRLDLSQAEAVSRLIHSKTNSSRKIALSQVEGQLSQSIHQFTEQLRNIQIFIEAWIDFPEEDLPLQDIENIQHKVSQIIVGISDITDTYNTGKVLSEGASILLVGRPNAGKSSLLNFLLGENRAIVSDVPGTTRDIIEEGMVIAGVPIRLFDTAGLRQSLDPVEMEGVRRAKQKIEQADLVLFLIDGSVPIDEQDLYAYRQCLGSHFFLICTKSDLDSLADTSFCDSPTFPLSVKEGLGVDALKAAISAFLLGDHIPNASTVMLSEQRHYDALIAAKRFLLSVQSALSNNASLEFIAIDIRDSLQYLGLISGTTTTDSVLAGIFSQFCIGK